MKYSLFAPKKSDVAPKLQFAEVVAKILKQYSSALQSEGLLIDRSTKYAINPEHSWLLTQVIPAK
ncbi:protein of unknown function [Vibrio tapetis subsp. tapetis]|uniref:Uncharacterized protein n=1 Tax=Vibrio tapetis subsp. tapetis TaxID=1671868 RepID=A0A2N8ZDC7_9VIBR|nr:protein of unknown function [Vibrio tapetis subsp. tapetis]